MFINMGRVPKIVIFSFINGTHPLVNEAFINPGLMFIHRDMNGHNFGIFFDWRTYEIFGGLKMMDYTPDLWHVYIENNDSPGDLEASYFQTNISGKIWTVGDLFDDFEADKFISDCNPFFWVSVFIFMCCKNNTCAKPNVQFVYLIWGIVPKHIIPLQERDSYSICWTMCQEESQTCHSYPIHWIMICQ